MSVRPELELADAIAFVLAENRLCSGTRLAAVLGHRKQTVLGELRDARRFERVGRGANSAWRVAGTDREPLCRIATPDPDHGVPLDLRDLLTAIEARLTAIERRIAPPLEPVRTDVGAPLVGQITVDEGITIATNGETPSS